MSSRIEQVLEVLKGVKEEYLENQSQHPVSSLRLKAVQQVASKREITNNSVSDKYIRQLKPDIQNTDDFDKCLSDWLIKGDNKIRRILLSRAVSKNDKDYINHFFENLPVMANRMVSNEQIEVDNGKESIVYPDENLSISKYLEGNSKRIYVNVYERNPKAKIDCIAAYGTTCSVCDFSFEAYYGEIGSGFIHVHHLDLISGLGANYEIDPVKDLRPVCPNCHAMLHKRNPPFTIEELKQMLGKPQSKCI